MKNLPIRIIKYILGLFIVTIGIGFAIESDFGSAPVSAFPYTLQIISGLDIGIGTIVFQSFLVLLQIIILRKKFKIKNLLQVAVSTVFGFMTGFSTSFIGMIPDTENVALRLGMVLLGSFFIALGIALYVPADIVPMPAEGFVKTVSEVSGRQFSNVKIAFDCTAVILSGVLCVVFTQKLTSVGLGTVILAILVGLINKQILKLFAKIGKKKEA